jgi:hypothetical protein
MEYTDFEYDLRRKIVPVAPDPAFVERLNERLRTQKKVFIEKTTNPISPFLLTMGVLLGIGLFLFLLGKNRQK